MFWQRKKLSYIISANEKNSNHSVFDQLQHRLDYIHKFNIEEIDNETVRVTLIFRFQTSWAVLGYIQSDLFDNPYVISCCMPQYHKGKDFIFWDKRTQA